MKLINLLQQITPAAYLCKYAEPGTLREKDGHLYGNLPKIGQVIIHAGGFLPTSPHIAKAWSVVDAMASDTDVRYAPEWEKRPHGQAIVRLCKDFAADLPPSCQDPVIQQNMAQQARYLRHIYNLLLCKEMAMQHMPGALGIVMRRQFGTLREDGTVWYVTTEALKEMVECFEALGIKTPISTQPAIVVPYFASVGVIAGLRFSYERAEPVEVWLDDYKYGITGVLGACLDDSYFVHPTLSSAMRQASHATSKGVSHVHLLRRSTGSIGWCPKQMYIVQPLDSLEWTLPIQLQEDGVECLVTPSEDPVLGKAHARTWSVAVSKIICRMLDEDKAWTDRICGLLSSVKHDWQVKAAIRVHLEETNALWLQHQLDVMIRDEVLWSHGDNSLYATAAGYYYETAATKGFGGDAVTNWTIHPQNTIRYDDGELYYVAEVSLKGRRYPVRLPATALDTPKKLNEHIQRQVMMLPQPPELTPAIFEPTMLRALIPHLFRRFSELPVHVGIGTLGWNGMRNSFAGPWWESQTQPTIRTAICKPSIMYLGHHNADPTVEASAQTAGIPPRLLSIAQQIAAMIARTYAGYEVTAVCYANTKETRDSLLELWSRLGQSSIVQLNQNIRTGDLNCWAGYPYLAIGYNRRQAKAVRSSMFLLGEEGPGVPMFSEYEYDAAAKYIRWILEQLPCYLIRNCGTDTPLAADILSAEALAVEGKIILQSLAS